MVKIALKINCSEYLTTVASATSTMNESQFHLATKDMTGSIKFFKGHKLFVISDEKVQIINFYFNKKAEFFVVKVNRKKVYFKPVEVLNLCSVRS